MRNFKRFFMLALFVMLIRSILTGDLFAQDMLAYDSSKNITENLQEPIPISQLGAEADRQVERTLPVMENGMAIIRAPFQAIYGEVHPYGLEVFSTSENEGKGSFSLTPITYSKGIPQSVGLGTVSLDGNSVLLNRGNIIERFLTSVDGIRQDFILPRRPAGSEDLLLELAVSGAKAENSSEGVKLTMDSGRELVYHQLYITDATGKEIAGTLSASADERIVIAVNDQDAVYPLTIDPTIADQKWRQGLSGPVSAIAVDSEGNLYVGGSFTEAGGSSANRIARWNGSNWSALGSGLNAAVSALAISGSNLYVGGYFTTAGGSSANRIARWNGSSWSALGSGLNEPVAALAISGSNLYVGGAFTNAGGSSANHIAKWNGSSWSSLGSGLNDGVTALAISGNDLYVGGLFSKNVGPFQTAFLIAKWDMNASGDSGWSRLGLGLQGDPILARVFALAVSGGDLYVGGNFTTANTDIPVNNVAKWNGSSWSSLGSGVNEPVRALAISGSDLYVGGGFTTAGGVNRSHIAKWNGSSWSSLGSGLDVSVVALAVSGDDLYVGGFFTEAGGSSANYIAKWDGTNWNPHVPTVTTQAVSNISTTTATGNGNITALGVPNPTQHGHVWSTSTDPTTALGTKTTLGAKASTGAFTSSITGLTAGTLYYVRAYAINDEGTVYGGEVSFTSLQVPAVTTQAVSSISTTTATGNGNVTALGVPNPTQHGHVWSTSTNPTIALGTKTTLGAKASTGAFTSSITGLTAGTVYYVRAYATNSAGTAYGNEISFTTLQQIFRSKNGGIWTDIANWEQSNGVDWVDATNFPGDAPTTGTANPLVTIQTGHQMEIQSGSTIDIPNLKINGTGKLTIKSGGKIYVQDQLHLDENAGGAILVE